MPVKIRLRRMGAKKRPFYRVVVADSRCSRDGRFIEQLGYYDPLTNPGTIKIETEKAKKWLSQGAQPTQVVTTLLRRVGVLESPKPRAAAPAPKPSKPKTKKGE